MSENRYLEDKTGNDGYYDGGLLNTKNIMMGSAAIAGSILAYKKGLLKPIAKEFMEMRAGHTPTITPAFNDLRKWLKSDAYAPENSIFRLGVKDSVKKFARLDIKNAREVLDHTKSIKETAKAIYDVDNARTIINDTKEDLAGYSKRFSKTLDRLKKSKDKINVKNSYHNTESLKDLKDIDDAANMYSDNFSKGKKTLKSKMYDSFLRKSKLSAEDAAQQLKQTGYRNATLEDLFEFDIDKNGKIKLTEKTQFSFSDNRKNGGETAKKKIEDMLNAGVISDEGYNLKVGKRNMKMHERHKDFGKMKIDSELHISENGKNFIDLRENKRSSQEFIRNLATEWQIPIIGVNPLRMFGVDKIGKRAVNFASISEDSVAPYLTGVRGNTSKETIRNLKDRVDVLKGVEEGVTIIDGDVFRMSDDGIGITKMDYKSKKRIVSVPKWQDYGTSALNPLENSARKMGGVSKRHFEDYNKEDGWKYYKQKLAKFFDVGYQESTHTKEAFDSLSDYSNPDSYIEKIISKIKPKPYKSAEDIHGVSGLYTPGSKGKKDTHFVMNESTKLKDVFSSKFDKDTVKDYFYQYGATFDKNYESVNSKTGGAYFMLERMNQTISSVGLGLSLESTSSAWDTGKNLLFKRFLPIYATYQGWNALNAIGEEDTENGKKPGNLNQHIMKGVVNADVAMHKFTEKIGLSKMVKNLAQITPGSDMLEELPGITALNLGDSAEERKEYWEKGYDPVRKGRFWSMNSTPFVGGKIQYWKPNAYRSSLADARYSDSLYGSRRERMANILDKDHYDKKHYYTRPYLMSSAAFENVPLVGPVLSSTVGRIVKPPKRMHEEYWNEDGPKTLRQIKEEEAMANQNYGYMMTFNELSTKSEEKVKETYLRDKETLSKVFDLDIKSVFGSKYDNNAKKEYTNFMKQRFYDSSQSGQLMSSISQEQNKYSIYRTNSGSMSIVDLGSDPSKASYTINGKNLGLGQVFDSRENVGYTDDNIITDDTLKYAKYDNVQDPYSLSQTLSKQYKDTANVAGMYGFLATGFGTGNVGAGETVIETSGYSRSFNREFWDKELGGAGGDISEIFRRFVQKRRTDVNYYNPVRNRMPDWLPGENGFIDFQHGDPYTKIARGEERLPGEGFERLNGIDIDEKLKMKLNVSSFGKDEDEIIKSIINEDTITDKDTQRSIGENRPMKEKIKKQLIESGIGLDEFTRVTDEKNNISGSYDLRINDNTSITGKAMMNIKPLDASGFDSIKRDGAKESHVQQMNWFLRNTEGADKGYIMYVNKDNPEETKTVGVNFNPIMYAKSMKKVNNAREDVMGLLNTGKISRADLYDEVDKFKILADVAPYSDEFREMNKIISSMKLTKEQEDEVRAARDRVSKQREPLRLYDYRFKYSDTIKERVEIGRQVNAETFMLKGSDEAIKLSGVNIVKSNPNYDKAMKFLRENMSDGDNVTIEVAEDTLKRKNKDMLQTTKAVVYSNGMNINRELIKRGLVDEDEKDFSATGIKARFNSLERGFGKAWENIAHFDSFANTKLLQVRSAAEDYERKHVYNKDFKEWQDPVKDFLNPFVWTNMNRTGGVLVGAAVGYMFGSAGSKYGKLLGGIAGGAIVGGAKIYKKGYEATTGEKWIPEEKRKERDLNDYMDKLKFVKNRKLFEVYSQKALNEDGIDVKQLLVSSKAQGKERKKRARELEEIKKNYKRTGDLDTGDFEDVGVKFKLVDKLPGVLRSLITGEGRDNLVESGEKLYNLSIYDFKEKLSDYAGNFIDAVSSAGKRKEKALMKTVNEEINLNKNDRKTFNLSENAMKAIQYYNESEKTMYGYDPGEELTNIISALPKKDRQYFRHFLEAPEQEREKILSIAPKYMRRALQNAYGMEVDAKESLPEYFSEHYLPGDDWDGWQENYDLNAMKVKMIQTQGLELGSFDMWQDDKQKADMYGPTAIPNMEYKTRDIQSVKAKMQEILGSSGYSDLDFSFSFGQTESTIDLQMYEDKKDRYEAKLKERLGVNI